MPGKKDNWPNEFCRMMLRHAPDRALFERAWKAAEPLVLQVYRDEYPLAMPEELDAEEYRAALMKALGCAGIPRLRFVSLEAPDALAGTDPESFANHVDMSLQVMRASSFQAFGQHPEGFDLFMQFMGDIGEPTLSLLFAKFAFAMPETPIPTTGMVVMTPCTYLLCYFGAVLANDAGAVADMAPLFPFLKRSIPIGEPFDELDTWLIGCA